jgi:hypothetical protein
LSGDGLKNSFDHAERIGVVGSPSSTHSLVIDILGTAADKRLVGSLSLFRYAQDSSDHYALGQITEIRLRNVWSEDPTMRGLIRQKGRVDPITERQDTHTATMLVSAVFGKTGNGFEPSMLGTVPATGTSVKLMNENIMHDLLADYSRELFYLGRAYGSPVLLPMWFKHFGYEEGGAGEAYHIGVFGKTGSGKSVLSKMVMLGYSKHHQMTIFVLDPQGEFARLQTEPQVADVLKTKLQKEVKVFDLHNLVLTGNELFKRILGLSGFFDRLGIFADENKVRAADQIDLILQRRGVLDATGPIKPWDFHKRETFNLIYGALQRDDILTNIYTGAEYRERVKSRLVTLGPSFLYEHWARVASLFAYEGKKGAVEIKNLTKSVTAEAKGQIIVINLSEAFAPATIFWNDDVRMIVINEFLQSLSAEAQAVYKQGKTLNTLVVLDEAHRLAPRERQENPELEQVKNTLKDAVRTTRKYGLGWMFVSQTLSSLDREIINQIRIYIFGFGLAYGIELQGLREIIGGNEEAISLYQLFKDPQSTPKQKEYSFMTIGPISPLSFSGVPLFFQATDYPEEFVKANGSTFA